MVRINIGHVKKFCALMEDFAGSIKNISKHQDTSFHIVNLSDATRLPTEFRGGGNEEFQILDWFPNFFFRSLSIKEPRVFSKDHLEVKFIIEGLGGARRRSDNKNFDILIEVSGHIPVDKFFNKF